MRTEGFGTSWVFAACRFPRVSQRARTARRFPVHSPKRYKLNRPIDPRPEGKPTGRERQVVGVPGRAQQRATVLQGTVPRLCLPAGNIRLAIWRVKTRPDQGKTRSAGHSVVLTQLILLPCTATGSLTWDCLCASSGSAFLCRLHRCSSSQAVIW